MRNTLTKALPLLAVAGLILTGCGSSSDVESVDDLAAAWKEYSGETCQPDEDKTDETWVCSDAATLSFYDDPKVMDERVDFLHELWGEIGMENTVLVGDNWMFVGEDKHFEPIQEELGGKVVTFGTND